MEQNTEGDISLKGGNSRLVQFHGVVLRFGQLERFYGGRSILPEILTKIVLFASLPPVFASTGAIIGQVAASFAPDCQAEDLFKGTRVGKRLRLQTSM